MKRKVLKAIPVLDLERERYIFPQKLGLRLRVAAKRFYMTDDDVLKKALPHVDLDTVGPITVQDAPTSSHITDFRFCCHVLMRVPRLYVYTRITARYYRQYYYYNVFSTLRTFV